MHMTTAHKKLSGPRSSRRCHFMRQADELQRLMLIFALPMTLDTRCCIISQNRLRGPVVNPATRKKRSPDPSPTRTDGDWMMIILGVLLVMFFVVAIYTSLIQGDKGAIPKSKGPVKEPKGTSLFQPQDRDSYGRTGRIFRSLHG
jgi:hypothetical protein